jgi:hypothetical protein
MSPILSPPAVALGWGAECMHERQGAICCTAGIARSRGRLWNNHDEFVPLYNESNAENEYLSHDH